MSLYQACQAWAGIHGRDYILPDDIKSLALPVLCHRMIVSPQAQLHGRSVEEMIKDIITAVPVPVES
jgi:MoxR-like ATPase